jgi:hypothetical protein
MGWKEVAVMAMVLAAPVGHAGGGAAPSWRAVAAEGHTFDATLQEAAAKKVEALPTELRQRVREALEKMAHVSPGAEGIQSAQDTLVAVLPGLEAPHAAFSGEGPHRVVARRAGVMVLVGLVAREARRVAQGERPDSEAAALLRTVEGLKGVDVITRNQLKEEARLGLGDALYLRTLPPEGSTQKGRMP